MLMTTKQLVNHLAIGALVLLGTVAAEKYEREDLPVDSVYKLIKLCKKHGIRPNPGDKDCMITELLKVDKNSAAGTYKDPHSQAGAKFKFRSHKVAHKSQKENVVDKSKITFRDKEVEYKKVDQTLLAWKNSITEDFKWTENTKYPVPLLGQPGKWRMVNANPLMGSDTRHYTRLASDVSLEFQNRELKTHDAPWIPIYEPSGSKGGLYVSCTISAGGSYKSLVKMLDLYYPGREYVVYTGRHGDLPNIVSQEGQTLHVWDEHHMVQDLITCNSIGDGIRIKAVHAGKLYGKDSDTRYNSSEHLRKAYRKDISEGKIVILAWCYSLFTFSEIEADEEGNVDPAVMRKRNEEEISKTIGQLVKEYFHDVDHPAQVSSPSHSRSSTGDMSDLSLTVEEDDQKSEERRRLKDRLVTCELRGEASA